MKGSDLETRISPYLLTTYWSNMGGKCLWIIYTGYTCTNYLCINTTELIL